MFKDKGFQVIRNAVSTDLVDHLITMMEFHKTESYRNKRPTEMHPYPWRDTQIEKCFATYSPPYADSVLKNLRGQLSEVTNTELLECYSYARIYYKGADMVKHVDRPSCEISATLALKKVKDWPIFIRDEDDNDYSIKLNPGDLMVYRGNCLAHWREELEEDYHYQMFLHYVDKNGPYAEENEYDGRDALGSNNRIRDAVFGSLETNERLIKLQLEIAEDERKKQEAKRV